VLLDQSVVIRQVVLSQQIEDERGSCVFGDRDLGDIPGFVLETLSPLPRNDVVEIPVGATGQMRFGERVNF
jgi:hypothetical protein